MINPRREGRGPGLPSAAGVEPGATGTGHLLRASSSLGITLSPLLTTSLLGVGVSSLFPRRGSWLSGPRTQLNKSPKPRPAEEEGAFLSASPQPLPTASCGLPGVLGAEHPTVGPHSGPQRARRSPRTMAKLCVKFEGSFASYFGSIQLPGRDPAVPCEVARQRTRSLSSLLLSEKHYVLVLPHHGMCDFVTSQAENTGWAALGQHTCFKRLDSLKRVQPLIRAIFLKTEKAFALSLFPLLSLPASLCPPPPPLCLLVPFFLGVFQNNVPSGSY